VLAVGNDRLTAILGRAPHAPLEDAVEATLVGLGSLMARSLNSADLRR
jgi:hypothetical protein